jgi:hypothetical protein
MTKYFVAGCAFGFAGVVTLGIVWRYGVFGWLGVLFSMAILALLYKKAVAA